MRVRTFHGVGTLPAEFFSDGWRVRGSRDVRDDTWTVYINTPPDAPPVEVYDAGTGHVVRRYGPGCRQAETLRHDGSLRVRVAAGQLSLW